MRIIELVRLLSTHIIFIIIIIIIYTDQMHVRMVHYNSTNVYSISWSLFSIFSSFLTSYATGISKICYGNKTFTEI